MQSSILFLMGIGALALTVLNLETRWMWVWLSTVLLNWSLAFALWGK
jgi:hypothetical protein